MNNNWVLGGAKIGEKIAIEVTFDTDVDFHFINMHFHNCGAEVALVFSLLGLSIHFIYLE